MKTTLILLVLLSKLALGQLVGPGTGVAGTGDGGSPGSSLPTGLDGQVLGHLLGSPVYTGIVGGPSGCIVVNTTTNPYTIERHLPCMETESYAWKGAHDFTLGTVKLPNGTTAPAVCAVGMTFFNTSVTAGTNMYGCTATNTWTAMTPPPLVPPSTMPLMPFHPGITTGASGLSTTNPRVVLAFTPVTKTVTTCTANVAALNVGTVAHLGLYTTAGNKLCSWDTIDMGTTGLKTGTCSAVIPAGWYYWAAGQTGATATLTTVSLAGTMSNIISNASGGLPVATAANVVSGSALPATLGALSPLGATTFVFPFVSCY